MLGLSFCCNGYPVQDLGRSLIFGPVLIKQLTFFQMIVLIQINNIVYKKLTTYTTVYLNEFDFKFFCHFRRLLRAFSGSLHFL